MVNNILTERRDFIKTAFGGFLASIIKPYSQLNAFASLQDRRVNNPPNFVIFISDDQSYYDMSCMGTKDVSTPNLDKLARTGVRFTDWYSNAPICAPSRAALLSGCYPVKAGLNVNPRSFNHNTGLPLQTPTLAEALKEYGYQTAHFGKWHLGFNEAYRPNKRGFDQWFGMAGGGGDYFSHIYYHEMLWDMNPKHDLWENGKEVWKNGCYLTDLITEKSVAFVNNMAKNNLKKPFFLDIWYTEPHFPMHTKNKYLDMFADLPWERRIMLAKLKALDDSVGEIMKALEQNNFIDNTMIFFMSDNGPDRTAWNWLNETPDPYYGAMTNSFRGQKQSLFEGGIRMPAIISWPGHIPQGKVCNKIGAAMDIFPTFLKVAGGDLSKYELDGKDIMPMITQNQPSPHEMLFWEFYEQTAVRWGKWKLVLNGRDIEDVSEKDKVHLADMESDEKDSVNVKDEYPEITSKLKKAAEDWREKMYALYDKKWKAINVDQRSDPSIISYVPHPQKPTVE